MTTLLVAVLAKHHLNSARMVAEEISARGKSPQGWRERWLGMGSLFVPHETRARVRFESGRHPLFRGGAS